MLYEVMRYCRNYFVVDAYPDTYTITDGVLSLSFLKPNQLYIIDGSTFNDGVHRVGDTDLIDEEFVGNVSAIAPPKAFLDLVHDIEAWTKDNTPSVYASESFNGYSYSRNKTTSGADGGYQKAFGQRLKVWRKI